MEGSVFWTTLDAASAYWSMPLDEEAKEKTAFQVPRGKYEFNVTPYGLCNAGASYQRLMDICLSGLQSKIQFYPMPRFIMNLIRTRMTKPIG